MATKTKSITVQTYCCFLCIIFCWIIAWLSRIYLFSSFSWIETPVGDFTYWTIAKILIWIIPAYGLIRLSGRSIADVYTVSNWTAILKWGFGLGILVLLAGFVSKYTSHQPLFGLSGYAVLNVLLIAPLFEEFLMRGAIFGNLARSYSFWQTNVITAIMFMVLHVPGWFFQGKIGFGITLQVLFTGLVCGLAAYKAKSTLASTIYHFLNNVGNL